MVQQRADTQTRNIAGPDDFCVIEIGAIVNPLAGFGGYGAITDDDQMPALQRIQAGGELRTVGNPGRGGVSRGGERSGALVQGR